MTAIFLHQEQIEVRECLLSFGAELFSSSLVSRNIKIKVERIIILPVVFFFVWVRNLATNTEGGT